MADSLHFSLFCALCVAVFVFDVLYRRVPNSIILGALGMQIVFISLSSGGLIYPISERTAALAGLVAGFAVFLPLYAFRAMGAGDVKFFALLGFWLGPTALIPVWLGGSLLAGIHAVLMIIPVPVSLYLLKIQGLRLWSWLSGFRLWRAVVGHVVTYRRGRSGIPYAAYLAVAAAGLAVWRG